MWAFFFPDSRLVLFVFPSAFCALENSVALQMMSMLTMIKIATGTMYPKQRANFLKKFNQKKYTSKKN